ncbi:MAG: helix-turn-helix domain-containing protein [Pseudomonadota bacterium]
MTRKSPPLSGSGLKQDPHAVRTRRENNLERALGREINTLRKRQRLTVTELSDMTKISAGMLSKIENGAISPSLTTLQSLANALGVPLVTFFEGYDEPRGVMHVKAGEGVEVARQGTRAGHNYRLLGHIGSNSSGVVVEPYLITLTAESDRFPAFQHAGIETIYMLEGVVTYRHGDQMFTLQPGDTLIFDADAIHGPEELTQLPIRYLSMISYPQGT